jgi:hypothetical protein
VVDAYRTEMLRPPGRGFGALPGDERGRPATPLSTRRRPRPVSLALGRKSAILTPRFRQVYVAGPTALSDNDLIRERRP